MITYPYKPYTIQYDKVCDQIEETLGDLETLRHDLGDELYNAVLKNRSKVINVINHRKFLRENARYKNLPTNGKNLSTFRKLNKKFNDRIADYKNEVNNRIRTAIKKVIHTSNYREESITRDDSKPYFIAADCVRRSGWGNSWTNYQANLPFNWLNTPARKVMEAFDNKFFAIECRHEIELSSPDVNLYWVNRAVRTAKVGFKPFEVGYAAINANEFTGFGATPALAIQSMKRDIAKAAKARLLATLKA
jgi:hypothetical protein